MNAIAKKQSAASIGRQMLNKVPEITLFFWIIKVLCTTVGETGADNLDQTFNLGLTNLTYIMGGVLAVSLFFQFRSRRYVPGLYWLGVVLISVVGTLFSDNLVDGYGISLTTTTPVFAAILALVFGAWYWSERTLSIHTIYSRRREAFYWLTILFTFALGTSAGDLVAEKASLGYFPSVLIFGAGIAAIMVAHFRFRLNAVLAFWLAYILTRPLGASIGDWMSQKSKHGGLNLGTTTTSYIFLGTILALVVFLSITRRDETPPDRVADEVAHEPHPDHHLPHPHLPHPHLPHPHLPHPHLPHPHLPIPETGEHPITDSA
jgi:uncharacterized membrane-anchored protein